MIYELTAGDTFEGYFYIVEDTTQIIENGVKYRVDESDEYTSVTYNDVVYERNDVFTGTTETVWYGDGTFSPIIDITGWEFYITIKSNQDDIDADALLLQTLSVLTNPTEGEAYFRYQESDWQNIVVGNAWIECKWKDADNNIETFDTISQFVIKPSLKNV